MHISATIYIQQNNFSRIIFCHTKINKLSYRRGLMVNAVFHYLGTTQTFNVGVFTRRSKYKLQTFNYLQISQLYV